MNYIHPPLMRDALDHSSETIRSLREVDHQSLIGGLGQGGAHPVPDPLLPRPRAQIAQLKALAA